MHQPRQVFHALLQYRNTPTHKDGLQKLYGHLVQDILPAHCCSFSDEWQCKAAQAEQQATQILHLLQKRCPQPPENPSKL